MNFVQSYLIIFMGPYDFFYFFYGMGPYDLLIYQLIKFIHVA